MITWHGGTRPSPLGPFLLSGVTENPGPALAAQGGDLKPGLWVRHVY